MNASITPQDLQELIRRGKAIELIDVRTPAEFETVHLDCARNVPLDQLNPGALMTRSIEEPLYFICQGGGRGQKACEQLCAAGFTNVLNVEGGTAACVSAGLPVVRGAKAVSLERQVRMAAGLLVLVAALLGFFVHPYWIILAAAIGAGLLFAGITDTCGMGMLLAKMPWNRVRSASTGAPNGKSTSCCCK